MKRFLSILLAVVMILSLSVPAFADRYTDASNSKYAKAIENLSGLGVVTGYEDGTYQPGKVVTRAEMATLLVRCLGLEMGANLLKGSTSFDDVEANSWASGYIAVAVQYGLIKGDGDGKFRPDDAVNYAEAATMVLRALGYDRVVEKAGTWPTNYLNKATELKVFEELKINDATVGATRETVAQMMWNMVGIQLWEVGEESEGDGLSYGRGRTMLVVKFPDYVTNVGTAATPVYKSNYIEASTVNDVTVVDKETIDVEFETGTDDTVVRYTNVSPLDFAGYCSYDVFFTVEKIDGASRNVGKSLFTNEDVVIGKITKRSSDSKEITVDGVTYKNSTGTAFAAGYKVDALVKLVIDVNGKVEVAKSDIFDGGAQFTVVKSIKTSTDGKKVDYTAFNGGTTFTVDSDKKDTMFVSFEDGKSKVISQADIKEGSVVEATALLGSDLYVVTNREVVGKVEKMADGKVFINGTDYVIATGAKVRYDNATTLTTLDAAEAKNLIGKSIVVTLDSLNNIIFVEANNVTSVSNYGFISEAWVERVNNELTYKVKIVGLNGVTSTYESYDFAVGVNKSAQVPAALINGQTLTTDVGYKTSAIANSPVVIYAIKDGKIDIAKISKTDNTIAAIDTANTDPITVAGNLDDTRKTIKNDAKDATYIVTSATKFLFAGVASGKLEVVTAEFDDLKTLANLEAAKVILEKEGSNKLSYVVIEKDSVAGAKKFAVVQSAENALADNEYEIELFDIATAEKVTVKLASSTNYVTNDIGKLVTYSVASNGKYSVETAVTADTARVVLDNADNEVTVEAGIGYTTILRASVNLDVKDSELKVIFVNADGVASVGSIESSVRDGYEVLGIETVSTSDAAYKTIVVTEK